MLFKIKQELGEWRTAERRRDTGVLYNKSTSDRKTTLFQSGSYVAGTALSG